MGLILDAIVPSLHERPKPRSFLTNVFVARVLLLDEDRSRSMSRIGREKCCESQKQAEVIARQSLNQSRYGRDQSRSGTAHIVCMKLMQVHFRVKNFSLSHTHSMPWVMESTGLSWHWHNHSMPQKHPSGCCLLL